MRRERRRPVVGRVEVFRPSDPWIDDPFYVSPWLEPSYVPGPGEAHVFFGAQVGFDRAREHPADRDGLCPQCGAGDDLATGILAEDGRVYCAKCNRWGRDGLLVGLMVTDLVDRGIAGPVFSPPDRPRGAHARAPRGFDRSPATFRFDESGHPYRVDEPRGD